MRIAGVLIALVVFAGLIAPVSIAGPGGGGTPCFVTLDLCNIGASFSVAGLDCPVIPPAAGVIVAALPVLPFPAVASRFSELLLPEDLHRPPRRV